MSDHFKRNIYLIIYNFPSWIRSIILLAITIFFICRQFGNRLIGLGNLGFGKLGCYRGQNLKKCNFSSELTKRLQNKCFQRSVKICEPVDIDAKKPRICGRQIMRDNVQVEGPEDYIRKSITVPFLDYTLNEMKTRFTDLHARTTLGAWGYS